MKTCKKNRCVSLTSLYWEQSEELKLNSLYVDLKDLLVPVLY